MMERQETRPSTFVYFLVYCYVLLLEPATRPSPVVYFLLLCFMSPFLAPSIVQEPIAMLPADSRLEMTHPISLYFISFVCFVFFFLTPHVMKNRFVLPEDFCSGLVG